MIYYCVLKVMELTTMEEQIELFNQPSFDELAWDLLQVLWELWLEKNDLWTSIFAHKLQKFASDLPGKIIGKDANVYQEMKPMIESLLCKKNAQKAVKELYKVLDVLWVKREDISCLDSFKDLLMSCVYLKEVNEEELFLLNWSINVSPDAVLELHKSAYKQKDRSNDEHFFPPVYSYWVVKLLNGVTPWCISFEERKVILYSLKMKFNELQQCKEKEWRDEKFEDITSCVDWLDWALSLPPSSPEDHLALKNILHHIGRYLNGTWTASADQFALLTSNLIDIEKEDIKVSIQWAASISSVQAVVWAMKAAWKKGIITVVNMNPVPFWSIQEMMQEPTFRDYLWDNITVDNVLWGVAEHAVYSDIKLSHFMTSYMEVSAKDYKSLIDTDNTEVTPSKIYTEYQKEILWASLITLDSWGKFVLCSGIDPKTSDETWRWGTKEELELFMKQMADNYWCAVEIKQIEDYYDIEKEETWYVVQPINFGITFVKK